MLSDLFQSQVWCEIYTGKMKHLDFKSEYPLIHVSVYYEPMYLLHKSFAKKKNEKRTFE